MEVTLSEMVSIFEITFNQCNVQRYFTINYSIMGIKLILYEIHGSRDIGIELEESVSGPV